MFKNLNKSVLKRIVTSGNLIPRKQFKQLFDKEINEFVKNIHEAYKLYKPIDKECKNDKRKGYPAVFIYNALHNLVCSFNLLMCGYIVPSGNLMRQFHESAAMAILLSSRKLTYFEKFSKDIKNFKVYQAPLFVKQNLARLNINKEGWDNFEKNRSFYHKYSHPTVLSLYSLAALDERDSVVVIGSYFDRGKIKEYRKEIENRIDAASCLKNIIQGVKLQLKN